MITKFMLSYTRETDLKKISDLRLTSLHYLRTDFIYDFLPIIPFQLLMLKNNRHCLFFIIKLMRLIQGQRLFDVPKLMAIFRLINKKQVELNACDCQVEDHNKLELLLIVSLALKIIRIAL
jgi:hypothetical protein